MTCGFRVFILLVKYTLLFQPVLTELYDVLLAECFCWMLTSLYADY